MLEVISYNGGEWGLLNLVVNSGYNGGLEGWLIDGWWLIYFYIGLMMREMVNNLVDDG